MRRVAITLGVVLTCAIAWASAQSPAGSDGWQIPADAAGARNPVPLDAGVLAKGRDLYRSRCARCHGSFGRGDGPDREASHPPGDLTDAQRASRNPDGVLFYKIWNGRAKPKMPAMKSDLSRPEVWTLVHFVKTLRGGSLTPTLGQWPTHPHAFYVKDTVPWWKRTAPPASDAPVAGMPLIRLERVTRSFESDSDEPAVALRDVTLDIDRGEYVAVSGPSGCGKSTFLSVLALLDTPTSGRYWLNGRDVDRLSPGERARVRNIDVGLIFQSFNLIADMSVFENVEYPLTIRGVSVEDRRARVTAALERVGIAARAKHRPSNLSGGHQQLVAIARAIAGQPAIVLADEPTGNLDSKAGEAVMQMLDELHAAGSTVCIATHDPRYIARARRHIYLLDGAVSNEPVRES